jgi:tRNA pseudouridine55 synthase
LNRLFVAYKPSGMSSNRFLSFLKRKYNVKKAGYSGTLDPFAKGVLIIGFGAYTRLFRFLDKTPKRYKATLWLGLKSDSLDTENIKEVKIISPFDKKQVKDAVESLKGELTYTPPLFSAKSINGQRAYDLAREGKKVELKEITSMIYDIKMLHYNHPFVTFEANVSEGTYIRSLGEIIAKKLNTAGALSSLERLNEGKFYFDDEKALDIKKSLNIKQNFYTKDLMDLKLGKKLALEDFKFKKDGIYFIDGDDFISIINIKQNKVGYEIGRMEVC